MLSKCILTRLFSPQLLDVDNDWLETDWNETVAAKLSALGDDSFLDAEESSVVRLAETKVRDTVISLSGSVPLRSKGLKALSKSGVVVYLDTPLESILGRLERMKVKKKSS